MATKRHERTLSRRQAIQVLYQSDILDESPIALLERGDAFIDEAKPSEYADFLVRGTAEHLPELDAHIKANSENWSMDRMPSVDRAILRLACYEMMYVEEVPISVAINEAVDLAKDFGGEDESPKFVNGVLGSIATELEQAQNVQDAVQETADGAHDKAPEIAANSEDAVDADAQPADAAEAPAADGSEAQPVATDDAPAADGCETKSAETDDAANAEVASDAE